MFISKLLPAALLTASILPSAMAADCYAKGLHRVTGSNIERSIKIQTGDSTFLYTQEPEGEDVCGTAKLQSRRPSNLKRIKGDGILRNPLQWQGDCGESGFNGCHLTYGDQEAIKGKLGDKEGDSYNVCAVKFDC